jgi:hypothetical protein
LDSERLRAVLCAAALALAGCSAADIHQDAAGQGEVAAPDAAALRAARLLSLSNNGALADKTKPYDLAVACVAGIDSLAAQGVLVATFSAEQKQAIAKARQLYFRRAIEAGGGASPRAIEQAVDDARTADNAGQLARNAVACLRRLA